MYTQVVTESVYKWVASNFPRNKANNMKVPTLTQAHITFLG